MPTQITATILKVVPTPRENVSQLLVSFNDGKGTWEKTYIFSTTHDVKLDRVKGVIKADLVKDLKPEPDTLAEVKKALNKPISFTI